MSIVQFICVALLINIFFSFFFLLQSSQSWKTNKKTNTHAHIKSTRYELERKKGKKSENPISALCSEACAVRKESVGRERNLHNRLQTCIHHPKKTHTHIFYFTFSFVYSNFFFIHFFVYITNVMEYFIEFIIVIWPMN
jgi:hypothetical protein